MVAHREWYVFFRFFLHFLVGQGATDKGAC
jgi:hypothetical protein